MFLPLKNDHFKHAILSVKLEIQIQCFNSNYTLFLVHRVKNEYGPQTKSNYINTYDKLMENQSPTKIKQEPGDCMKIPTGIKERLQNAETFLNIKSEETNLYKRLKAIEDRILYLETLSPEYNHFLVCITAVRLIHFF